MNRRKPDTADCGRGLTDLGITPERAREWLVPEIERLASAKRAEPPR